MLKSWRRYGLVSLRVTLWGGKFTFGLRNISYNSGMGRTVECMGYIELYLLLCIIYYVNLNWRYNYAKL